MLRENGRKILSENARGNEDPGPGPGRHFTNLVFAVEEVSSVEKEDASIYHTCIRQNLIVKRFPAGLLPKNLID